MGDATIKRRSSRAGMPKTCTMNGNIVGMPASPLTNSSDGTPIVSVSTTEYQSSPLTRNRTAPSGMSRRLPFSVCTR